MSVCTALKGDGHIHLLYTAVRWLSKGRSLASFWVTRASSEISSRKLVTTGSSFWWHRIGHKICLLVWHIQPAQQTQSVTLGESNDFFQGTFKAKLELWRRQMNIGIFDISNITRDLERDWARVFFLPAGAWSPVSAFKRVWALLSNYKRPPDWERMDPQPIF